MPEGHTIHRLARDHARALRGQQLAVSSPQGRFAGASAVDGCELAGTDAWGKHLFHLYSAPGRTGPAAAAGSIVHVHLGLYGTFTRHAPLPPPPPRPTCRMRLVGDEVAYDLVGPTACRLVTPEERDGIVARLGPDPIRRDADPERAWAALRRRRAPIGQVLLDQGVVAGVGNVFRAEALFVHGIAPERPATAIDRETWDGIWSTLVTMLRRGVTDRRIITVDPAEVGRRSRTRLPRALSTYVYRQARCLRCDAPVRRWELGGRWAYACPVDQPD